MTGATDIPSQAEPEIRQYIRGTTQNDDTRNECNNDNGFMLRIDLEDAWCCGDMQVQQGQWLSHLYLHFCLLMDGL